MSNWARRQMWVKRKKEEDTKDCGYNRCGYCSNEDTDWYFVKCPFKFLNECPVHNENLS